MLTNLWASIKESVEAIKREASPSPLYRDWNKIRYGNGEITYENSNGSRSAVQKALEIESKETPTDSYAAIAQLGFAPYPSGELGYPHIELKRNADGRADLYQNGRLRETLDVAFDELDKQIKADHGTVKCEGFYL